MTEINWMAGGPQGSGVDTAANIFVYACGYGGLNVYGRREYHSNIKGKHSYFHVRVSPGEVMANVNDVDLLAAFDAETVVTHVEEVVPGGGIIVDEEKIDTDIFDIKTLPTEFKEEYGEFLKRKGIGDNVKDLLMHAERKGVKVFQVPYGDLLKRVADKLGVDSPSKLVRVINVLTTGVSFGLLSYDEALVERAVRKAFSDKPKIIDMNVVALNEALSYTKEAFNGKFRYQLEKQPPKGDRLFIQGHQSVALGKILGGCKVQTYYPITPASDESEFLEAHEIFKADMEGGKGSIVVFQTEDELAAINLANGAALTGARAATSTSGPGFSLMVEGLGWAGNSEVPVVVTYYQRGAPSTGLPTRHGQDDLRFAIHAGHGEFARIVLASGDIRECFYDAANAFNYAERYQLPVIHLIDKALANSYQIYPYFDTSMYKIVRGEIASGDYLGGGEYKRFKFTDSGVSPRAFLGTENSIQWYTGDEHNESGHITEHPSTRSRMVEKRMKKLDLIEKEVPVEEKVNFFGDEDASSVVVSWGSTKGAIIESVDRLKKDGVSVGFLQVRMVHPLPVDHIRKNLEKASRIVDVEMNFSGQLGGIIREQTGIIPDSYVVKYNGRPMTATEVYGALKKALGSRPPKRQVLTHGA